MKETSAGLWRVNPEHSGAAEYIAIKAICSFMVVDVCEIGTKLRDK